ncbi:MAG: molecular chaperone SurA, partial [Massilia sp.]
MMRTTRLQSLQLAAALLCAMSAGQVLAQAAAPAAGTPAATTPAAATPAASSGFLPPASANAKVVDSIQVVVNDEVITRNEVAGRMVQVTANMKARNAQMPDTATMERQVLEAMIVER